MLTRYLSTLAVLACLGSPALAQDDTGQAADGGAPPAAAMGQDPGSEVAAGLQPAVATQLTFRSHSVPANASAGNLEGAACPTPSRMISGACHPGYNDRVIIINQFPNISANTWRCGFRNNNNVARTVWIYTVCAQ